jgi:hypothetical protein
MLANRLVRVTTAGYVSFLLCLLHLPLCFPAPYVLPFAVCLRCLCVFSKEWWTKFLGAYGLSLLNRYVPPIIHRLRLLREVHEKHRSVRFCPLPILCSLARTLSRDHFPHSTMFLVRCSTHIGFRLLPVVFASDPRVISGEAIRGFPHAAVCFAASGVDHSPGELSLSLALFLYLLMVSLCRSFLLSRSCHSFSLALSHARMQASADLEATATDA